jgi:hypothetical protein
MKMQLRPLALAGLVFAGTVGILASASNATQIIQTQPFTGVPNYNSVLPFNQYSGNPLDLVSIEVILHLDITGGQLIVDNDGAGVANVTNVELGATGALSSTDVIIVPGVNAAASTLGNYVLAADNGDGPSNIDGTGPDGVVMLGQTQSDTDSQFINSGVWLLGNTGYLGGGVYGINVNVNNIINFGAAGGVEGGFSPVGAGGEVTVIYNVVPEPASMALLALAGSAMAIRRRR